MLAFLEVEPNSTLNNQKIVSTSSWKLVSKYIVYFIFT